MLQSFRVISVAAILASTIACGDDYDPPTGPDETPTFRAAADGTFVALPERNGPSQDAPNQDAQNQDALSQDSKIR
jgi:hypothetical protein